MKIILSVAVAMFLLGCSDDAASSKKEEILKKVNETTQKVIKEEKKVEKKVVETVQEKTQVVVHKVEDLTDANDNEAVVEPESEETIQIEEKATTVVKPKKVIAEKVVKDEPVVVAKNDNGEKLYKSTCLACHGMNAEKKALTKSQVIQAWSVSKVENALHGYKNKTYGASMKTIMEGKVKNLSDTDITALANYISKL